MIESGVAEAVRGELLRGSYLSQCSVANLVDMLRVMEVKGLHRTGSREAIV